MTFSPYPKEQQTKRPKAPPKDTKKAYAEATEAARCEAGYLRCQDCNIPLRDQDTHRHHVIYRSQGGPTEAWNLRLLCEPCHRYRHEHGGRAASDYLSRPTLHGTYSTVVNA